MHGEINGHREPERPRDERRSVTTMTPEQTKRLRGAILEVLNDNHRAQKPRLDLSVIWAVLQKLGHNDLFKNDLVTVLQDLRTAATSPST
jgi:hypothetical protein